MTEAHTTQLHCSTSFQSYRNFEVTPEIFTVLNYVQSVRLALTTSTLDTQKHICEPSTAASCEVPEA